MSKSTGFNMQDFFSALKPAEGNMEEPKVDQLTDKLRTLQQAKRSLKEDIEVSMSTLDSLQKELATLQVEACQLDGIQKDKEESLRVLQFQCEEAEQESARLLQQKKSTEDLLEQHKCQTQEFKLKHRKQQMKFENQLHQLIEQHKNLQSVFMPQNLPAEVASAENTNSQLLAAEQLKMSQLCRLATELEMVRNQETAETQKGEREISES